MDAITDEGRTGATMLAHGLEKVAKTMTEAVVELRRIGTCTTEQRIELRRRGVLEFYRTTAVSTHDFESRTATS